MYVCMFVCMCFPPFMHIYIYIYINLGIRYPDIREIFLESGPKLETVLPKQNKTNPDINLLYPGYTERAYNDVKKKSKCEITSYFKAS